MNIAPPSFIPRIDDKSLLGIEDVPKCVLIDAQINLWRKNVLPEYKKAGSKIIINPSTHRLPYQDAQTSNFIKLPYFIKPDEIEKLYADANFRLEKFVKPCITYQIDNGADIVLAPFLHSEENHSRPFNLNLTLLSETIKHKQFEKWNLPLYAVINISSHILDNISDVNYIVSMYCSDQYSEVDGFLVIVDCFKEKDADEQTLRGFAHLVHQLTSKKNVIVNYVGGFGDVLSAIGAEGVISALWYGDSISIKDIDVNDDGIGRRKKNWTYIPELFTYVNDDDVKKIGYTCNCPACNRGTPIKFSDKKLHYYYRRTETVEAIKNIKKEDRVSFVISNLESAFKLSDDYYRKYAVQTKRLHIPRWIAILKDVQHWKSPEEEDKELEDILNTIDKNKKNDSSSS